METKLDTREFDRALREYIPTTKRSLAEVCNKRALNIAFRAMAHTPKVPKEKIYEELQAERVSYTTKSGKKQTRITGKAAPLLYKIIQSRRAKHGEKGLQGAAMRKYAVKMIRARLGSNAAIKSGWRWAIASLARVTGRSDIRLANDPDVRLRGLPKGSAIPAKDSWTPSATIINTFGSSKHGHDKALEKYGTPALQKAVNDEARELLNHVQKKLQADANKVNGR